MRARTTKLSPAETEAMIEEATVDAHDDGEQAMGWESALDAHLELPFTTRCSAST